MQVYKATLRTMKQFLVFGEVVIMFLRLISQIIFTFPSAIEVIQVLVGCLIYCRDYCSFQAQVYIACNFVLLYALGYNEIFSHFTHNAAETPLNENFRNEYKVWGYCIQAIFRLVGLVVAWRCYQFSEIEQLYIPYDMGE